MKRPNSFLSKAGSAPGFLISGFYLLFIFLLLPSSVLAQTGGESIRAFDVEIRVDPSGVLHVREKIQYDFGSNVRHGIYREIPRAFPSVEGVGSYALVIENVQIESLTAPAEFTRDDTGSDYVFKIGDPDSTITGEHTYTIEYDAHNAIAFYEDFDEVYWNATGNGWNVPIGSANLTITVPETLQEEQLRVDCYSGAYSIQGQCKDTIVSAGSGGETIVSFAEEDLMPGEGLTGALGFQKGVVPEIKRELVGLSKTTRRVGFGAILFAWITIFLYARNGWVRYRRDAEGRHIIVRQYEAPEGLSPLEAGFLVDKHIHNRDITAEMVYLAEMGYVHIVSIPQKILFLKKSAEFYVLKMKETGTELKEHQRLILDSLFSSSYTLSNSELSELTEKVRGNSAITTDKARLIDQFDRALEITALKDLQGGFYADLEKIKSSVRKEVMDAGLLNANNSNFTIAYFLVSMLLLVVSFVFIFAFAYPVSLASVLVFAGSFALFILSFRFFPMYRKTEAGVQASEHTLGLKEYLSIAEKDRLEFHFNPKNNPKLFEKLLPYAIMLKVDTEWAKELEEIYIEPDWYTDASSARFTVGALQSSFSGFTTAASSSYASPSSSGSGGGGFSGGGGGGGGGGSW